MHLRSLVGAGWLLGLAAAAAGQADDDYDLVVYGGTSAGVVAAVQAARDGLRVALVSPDRHLGGMSSSGLGATDVGNKEAIGGLAREFYRELRRHYADAASWVHQRPDEFPGRGHRPGEDAVWTFEPHVAETLFDRWTESAAIDVWRGERLDRGGGVQKRGARIAAITTESGRRLAGHYFVDATYEGDLLAAAAVPFVIGREANSTYGETLNGVQTANAIHHQFTHPVDPYVVAGEEASGLLPGIGIGPGAEGQADGRIQAYCFRICATDAAANRRPWPKPADYDPALYELLLRHFDAGNREIPWHPVPMPNRKTDSNNNKAVSTDFIGANYRYPTASYAERDAIVGAHRSYTQGLLWTLANHQRVPPAVREHFAAWGLAKDEFVDNDNWPYLLYVREARRMVGKMVMTEKHCRGLEPVVDPVGMGAYAMDSHNVQRYVDAAGHVRNEGDVQIRVPPYGISYRALIPTAGDCVNLVVPVCVSASHIAYGSIRMEPVFMVLGQSAAAAVALARPEDRPLQELGYAELRRRLLDLGQVLELDAPEPPKRGIPVASVAGLVADDADAALAGDWVASTSVSPFVGSGYRHDGDAHKGELRAKFEIPIPNAGDWDVQVAYTAHANRARRVAIVVHALVGEVTSWIDQRQQAPIDGLWQSVGVYRFAGDKAVVEIGNGDTDGFVVIDAVRLLPR